MSRDRIVSTRLLWLGSVALAVITVGGLFVWWIAIHGQASGRPASPKIVADFFTSLAALDVEENQLAATILSESVQEAPREPALWANLTIAHLRLRDLESAQETLRRAVALGGDRPEIAVLEAATFEQNGNIEVAIDKLRQVYHAQPEIISAAYSLVSLLGRLRTPQADAERLSLLTDILTRAPENLRARCEQSRLAATLEQAEMLTQSLNVLTRDPSAWPEAARIQLERASEAATAQQFRESATTLTIFENLVKPLPDYQTSLSELGASETAIGAPLREFLKLTLPTVKAAAADLAMTFSLETFPEAAARPDLVLALPHEGERRSTLMSLSNSLLQVGGLAALPFPGSSTNANTSSVLMADLNADFRLDLVLAGPDGCRIYLQQEDGSFLLHDLAMPEFSRAWRSVWSIDLEADGDLDLLLSDQVGSLQAVQNNGDLTFTTVNSMAAATDVVDLTSADLDQDGDVDQITLDGSGQISVWLNQRNGQFIATEPPDMSAVLAMAAGDVNRDGRFDLVTLSETGRVQQATLRADGAWTAETFASWPRQFTAADVRDDKVRMEVADLDNNGAVDILGTVAHQSAIWLSDQQNRWTLLDNTPRMFVTSIDDTNSDGRVDLVGITEDAGIVALNQSSAGYDWLFMQPRATTGAGDKRMNSFGIGGRIEVRAGYLVQVAGIRSPWVHFGLGRHASADVARIVWPNGTIQAEFDLQAKAPVVAQQRLKGSCPWVFAFNGQEYRFVKDFIWRSPLGLRINAQDTAGVTQTEDWIKIPGQQLVAVDGYYLLRITAELWESHFFDHISLVAVDHPSDVEVFVDERFVATAGQDQTVITTSLPQPVEGPIDQSGVSLESELRQVDNVYADHFELGEYQGVAEEHWVEFQLPARVDASRKVVIVAVGWVYPTDSSLNVAIAQSDATLPRGLVLEQQDQVGHWKTLRDGLGFPAGKNKDVLIPLPEGTLTASRRLRLRTNTETYWDSLGWAYRVTDRDPQLAPAPIESATLRFRGYSKLAQPTQRRRPDIPLYQVEATGQRWLDLEGFYTRFGDVGPILTAIDNRYVIMNAGDELVLEFAVPNEPPAGWERDFVLVGDGWVKDGDLNTAFSQWVRPLPAHDVSDYLDPIVPLNRDPVYVRFADDWRTYHTRYVTPGHFQRGLWPPVAAPPTASNRP